MPFIEAVRLALSTIRVQKLKSFFTLLGVMIGVMFLIAVVSIVEGMGRYMEEDFAGALLGVNTFTLRRFPDIRMVVFGHLGDGNLHYNVSPATDHADEAAQDAFLARQPEINRITHDAVAAFDGSISAEHGLGVLRRDEAARYKSPVEIELMWRIKRALDPGGIMNPGKVLAPPAAS